MENKGVDIQSVQLGSENIVISYVNGATESHPNTLDTYKAFNEKWLKNNPPFISDIFKVQMRNIILSCNGNFKCQAELQKYFQPGNEESVKKFFTYMRKRDDILPSKRASWSTPVPAAP